MGGPYTKLTLGVNLKGHSGSVTMPPGSALVAQDVMYREDGPYAKQWGWLRKNITALGGTVYGMKGFSYKGKNSPDVRPGNYGANDGDLWTKRADIYSGFIALTDGDLLRWDAATEAFVNVSLPAGTTGATNPKPTFLVRKDLVYIVGWSDYNLKYDPVEEAVYWWGWDVFPSATGVVNGVGEQLSGRYKYWASWINIFTGEESPLHAITFGGNPHVDVDGTEAVDLTLKSYGLDQTGDRHYSDGADRANEDIGIVIYRTAVDQEVPYFLDLVHPDVTAATPHYTDDGSLEIAYDYIGDVSKFIDPPVLNQFTSYATQWYGVSWAESYARVYWNDFTGTNSFWERTDVRNYREFPLSQGEVMVGIVGMERNLIGLTNLNAFQVYESNAEISIIESMEWTVGAVGPRASIYKDGWLYFISERGPYKWRPGLAEPDFIGEPIGPLFIDPITGLCQLAAWARELSEVAYDPDARVMRFTFPCGTTTKLNRHASYWIDAGRYNGTTASGWALHSYVPQAMDYTHALHGLVGGLPVTPTENKGRFVFADEYNYVCSMEPDARRGGIPTGPPVRGVVQAFSSTSLIITSGSLYTSGDGLANARLEVRYADGTVDVTTVASNTSLNIVPTDTLSQDPIGAWWYVAGVPAIWRSWVDHMGQPTAHKDLIHLYIGYAKTTGDSAPVIDVTVAGSHDWPSTATATKTAQLKQHRDKMTIAQTKRFFTYEMANTLPDEDMLVTYLETEEVMIPGRRKP